MSYSHLSITKRELNERIRRGDWKGYDFTQLSDEDLQKVVDLINHRPRKCLNYRTPAEV